MKNYGYPVQSDNNLTNFSKKTLINTSEKFKNCSNLTELNREIENSFSNLIENSYLTQTENSIKKQFPFLLEFLKSKLKAENRIISMYEVISSIIKGEDTILEDISNKKLKEDLKDEIFKFSTLYKTGERKLKRSGIDTNSFSNMISYFDFLNAKDIYKNNRRQIKLEKQNSKLIKNLEKTIVDLEKQTIDLNSLPEVKKNIEEIKDTLLFPSIEEELLPKIKDFKQKILNEKNIDANTRSIISKINEKALSNYLILFTFKNNKNFDVSNFDYMKKSSGVKFIPEQGFSLNKTIAKNIVEQKTNMFFGIFNKINIVDNYAQKETKDTFKDLITLVKNSFRKHNCNFLEYVKEKNKYDSLFQLEGENLNKKLVRVYRDLKKQNFIEEELEQSLYLSNFTKEFFNNNLKEKSVQKTIEFASKRKEAYVKSWLKHLNLRITKIKDDIKNMNFIQNYTSKNDLKKQINNLIIDLGGYKKAKDILKKEYNIILEDQLTTLVINPNKINKLKILLQSNNFKNSIKELTTLFSSKETKYLYKKLERKNGFVNTNENIQNFIKLKWNFISKKDIEDVKKDIEKIKQKLSLHKLFAELNSTSILKRKYKNQPDMFKEVLKYQILKKSNPKLTTRNIMEYFNLFEIDISKEEISEILENEHSNLFLNNFQKQIKTIEKFLNNFKDLSIDEAFNSSNKINALKIRKPNMGF